MSFYCCCYLLVFCGLRTSPLSTPAQNHSKLIQGDAVGTKQTCTIINTSLQSLLILGLCSHDHVFPWLQGSVAD